MPAYHQVITERAESKVATSYAQRLSNKTKEKMIYRDKVEYQKVAESGGKHQAYSRGFTRKDFISVSRHSCVPKCKFIILDLGSND